MKIGPIGPIDPKTGRSIELNTAEKRKNDHIKEVRDGLDSPEFEASISTLINLITALNNAGLHEAALQIQKALNEITDTTNKIQNARNFNDLTRILW